MFPKKYRRGNIIHQPHSKSASCVFFYTLLNKFARNFAVFSLFPVCSPVLPQQLITIYTMCGIVNDINWTIVQCKILSLE